MSFARAFLRTLFWRPGAAMTALYWHLTGKRVRARNRLRIAAQESPHAYWTWINDIERPDDEAARATGPDLAATSFTIWIVGSGATGEATSTSLAGLEWGAWEVIELDALSGQAFETALAATNGDWIVPLAAGTRLAPLALLHLARAIAAHPGATVLYGDHDRIGAGGERAAPWFKPLWNLDLFLAQDYVTPVCALAASAVRDVLPFAARAEAAFAFASVLAIATNARTSPVHVPHVLAHLPDETGAKMPVDRMDVVSHHLAATGAVVREGAAGAISVAWPLPEPLPLVSIVVPTRDNLGVLRDCVTGVLERTDYPGTELLIVDNGSTSAAMLAYLEDMRGHPGVRVLRDDGPFNFSAINNRAVAAARGEYICLLNDDTEVVEPAWLSELMRHAVRHDVGAVGAKLLYDDGSIQHAGVTIGLGNAAGHAHRFQRPGASGYFHRADVTHAVSAVTAACLVVSKARYEAVGGLDEEAFAVAFNDVDFCLKLQRAGWKNIYEPRAVLLHHESKSRDKDHSPGQIARWRGELAALQSRWGTVGYVDPLFHPRLDLSRETYQLRL